MSQKEHGEVRSTSGTLKGIYHYLNSPSPHLFSVCLSLLVT